MVSPKNIVLKLQLLWKRLRHIMNQIEFKIKKNAPVSW